MKFELVYEGFGGSPSLAEMDRLTDALAGLPFDVLEVQPNDEPDEPEAPAAPAPALRPQETWSRDVAILGYQMMQLQVAMRELCGALKNGNGNPEQPAKRRRAHHA